jgi:hypothetical protein
MQNYVLKFSLNSTLFFFQTHRLVIDIILNIQRGINAHLSTTLCAMELFDDRHVFHNWACLPCMKFQIRYGIVVK